MSSLFPSQNFPPQKRRTKNNQIHTSYEETWRVGSTLSTGYALHVVHHWPQLTPSLWHPNFWSPVHCPLRSKHWCCWQWLCLEMNPKSSSHNILQRNGYKISVAFAVKGKEKDILPPLATCFCHSWIKGQLQHANDWNPTSNKTVNLHKLLHTTPWSVHTFTMWGTTGIEDTRRMAWSQEICPNILKHIQLNSSSLLQLSQLNTKFLRCYSGIRYHYVSLLNRASRGLRMIQPGPAERPSMGSSKSSLHEGLPGVRWCWRRSTTWKGNHLLVQLESKKWGKCWVVFFYYRL